MLRVEHDCDIPHRNGDILFLPGRGPIRKMLDAFRLSIMASEKNPSAQKYLRSRFSIILEKRRHLRNYTSIIHPYSIFRYEPLLKPYREKVWQSKKFRSSRFHRVAENHFLLCKNLPPTVNTLIDSFRHVWDFLMIFTSTALLIAIPYQASFDIRQESRAWTFVKNSLLLICCMDIFINSMTGYFDKEQHMVVMERRKIINRYAKTSTLIPDLLGSLPTDLIFIKAWNENTVARKMSSLIFIFRVFSLSSYIGRTAFAYDTPLAVYEFCIIIYWLMIVFHWQSCLYWFVPIATASMHLPKRPRNDSWLHDTQLWEASKGKQYLACYLRAVATFFRSGFLRTDPENVPDLYMVIFMQTLGILTSWILVGRVMQFFKGANSSRLRYQGAVAELKQYMRHKQLPYSTQRRIMEYYEFRFQHRYFREHEILYTLSAQMRQEIGMHSCRKLVENVTFFNNLPLSLLGRIVSLLRSEIFLTNDVIVRANQKGDCMYFIATGTVAIYTDSGKEVCHLEDGAHFGEIALVMPDDRRVASVVAVEVCELYRLGRADFSRTIYPYPMLWERIKNIAIERHEKTTILNAQ